MVKNIIAKTMEKTITSVTSYSVNTACWLVFGQKKEPVSLKRLKKQK
ncbi:cyclic lactone autoinducer peptide [[Eubacterium] hominis]